MDAAVNTQVNTSFKVPEQFKKVSMPVKLDLKHADINGNQELWLLRIPAGLDITSLQQTEISLVCPSEHTLTENSKLICYPSKHQDIKELTVLLPDTYENCMVPVKQQLHGHMTIFEQIALPTSPLFSIEENHQIQLPQNLKQRYVPFGSEKVKVKDEIDHISETSGLQSEEDMENEQSSLMVKIELDASHSKIRRKKKRNSAEDEKKRQHDSPSSVTKKEKKKKKKKEKKKRKSKHKPEKKSIKLIK